MRDLIRSACQAAHSVFLLIFMEWMFLLTKPSFLKVLSFERQIFILCIAASLLIGLTIVAVAMISALFWVVGRGRDVKLVGAAVSAVIVTVTAMLMLDNFTYIVLHFSIKDLNLFLRLLYAGFLLWIGFVSGRALSKARTAKLSYLVILPSFMLIILIWQLAIVPKTLREQTTPQTASPSSRKLPNIILFAADGVNADHLSMYGYGRNTTPHLARLAKKGFVVKNVASNSSETYSSLLSVLTGRLPTTLKVNYAPQILAGENSYLHLPGILKTLGYSTYQVSIRYYGDAADANLRRAFDKANGRDVHASSISQWLIHLEPAANLFLDNVWSRIVSKIRYLAGQGPAVTEFDQVNNTYQPDVRGWKYDKIRITDAINYIKNDQPPFFLHIHLMGTHCCGFSPKKRVFSAQHEKQNKGNRADFYDDAILESDAAFGYLVNRLARWNYLKNTIIVYFSDHPAHWDFKGRVPLIFIFPDLGYNGKGPDEGQLIDVAPTLLEKLKQSIPTWMEGQSLFEPGLVNHRPAYISSQPMKRHKVWNTKVLMHVWTIDEIGPPAYGLKTMAMKICNQWFNYDLKSSSLVTGNIPGYQGQCDEKAPSNSEIKEMIRRHLQERGYKV